MSANAAGGGDSARALLGDSKGLDSRGSSRGDGANSPLLQEQNGVSGVASDTTTPRPPLSSRAQVPPGTNDASIVQFSAAILFGDKREGVLKVDLLRLGEISEPSSVSYFTEDGGAQAGITYQAVSGEVVFEPGEHFQSFEVPLIASNIWAATREFKICLKHPQNCELGKYLHTCRVKVIDDNAFPSNKHRAELENGQLDSLNMTSLFWEYCKWNFYASDIAKSTVLTVFLDQLANLYLLLTIRVQAYLVNVVCHQSDDTDDMLLLPSRWWTAQVLSAAVIIPFAILHLWELLRLRLDVLGHSAASLQRNLFRKYLNYSESSRVGMQPEHLQFAIMEEAAALSGGYCGVLDLLKTLGKLFIQFYFIGYSNPRALWILFLMALVMFMWAAFRNFCSTAIGIRNEMSSLTRHTQETCSNFDVISEYFLRPQVNQMFADRSNKLREEVVRKNTQVSNTRFVLEWTSPLFVGLYTAFAIRSVVKGDLPLGTFLATIHVVNMLGSACLHVNQIYIDIHRTFKQLRNITHFLNKETDLMRWKNANRHRRSVTKELVRDSACSAQKPMDFDSISIKCHGMGFLLQDGREILKDVTLEVPQGKIVAVVGPHGSGKSMFLRLMAHQLFPGTGDIFVPSHLRLLHVQRHAQILDRTLLQNLTLGCLPGQPPDLERIKAILEELTLEKFAQQLESEVAGGADQKQDFKWVKSLTNTEKNLIGLARAFIMNPEVMILQSPGMHYQKTLAEHVESLIVTHVEQRGLCLPEGGAASRRPRTVLYTTHDNSSRIADLTLTSQPYGADAEAQANDQLITWTIAAAPDGQAWQSTRSVGTKRTGTSSV